MGTSLEKVYSQILELMHSKLYVFLLIVCSWCCTGILFGQEADTLNYEGFQIVVDLDVFEVTASREAFEVDDFIDLVQTDESFYKAFHNIRFLSYQSSNDIAFFDKRKRSIARYHAVIKQESDGKCRTMEFVSEEADGRFFKKQKEYRYYTAKMLDRLFFTHKKRCEERDLPMNAIPPQSKMGQYVAELKKLIFSPGEEVDVPMIGKKMAIFEPEMRQFYDFRIRSERYKDKTDCYVFSALVKPEYVNKTNKTVLKELHTYFDKDNFQVVARDYELRYSLPIYDFDVNMKVELGQIGNQYVPTYIHYDGNWDVPFKKPEIAVFDIRFWGYQ